MRGIRTLSYLLLMIFISTPMFAGEKSDYYKDYSDLRDRYFEYMSLRKVADYNAIYEMTSSSFKKQVSFDKFMQLPSEPTTTLMAYYLDVVDVDGSNGTIYYTEYSIIPGVPSPRMRTSVHQHWVKEAGKWVYDKEIKTIAPRKSGCGGNSRPKTDAELSPPACGSRKK